MTDGPDGGRPAWSPDGKWIAFTRGDERRYSAYSLNKLAIVASDGHDTVITEIPDIVNGTVWPGAYARALRNGFIEKWLGREGELRRRWKEVVPTVRAARAAGDADRGTLLMGEDAGLIDSIEPAAALVERLAAEAEAILRKRARDLVTG